MLHKSDYSDRGVPLVNPINIVGDQIVPDLSKLISKSVKKRLAHYVLEEGDVVVARRGEIGRCAVVGQNESGWMCGTGSFFIRPSPSTDSQFLAHLIRSADYREKLEKASTGTTMKNLSNTTLSELIVEIPSLSEQKRIVGILDEAFNNIATAKANTEKNLQNARALFESQLQSVFTQHSKGWVQETLENVCHQITDGKHGDCEEQDGSGFYFLSAKDIKGGTPNWERARQITKRDFEETHRRTNLEPDDILITNSGTIGRMAIAPKDDRTTKTTFQKSVAILKPRKSEIDSKFAFYCLSSGLTRFVNLSAGAAQKNLLLRDLRNYRFSLPKSLDQQIEVARKLNDVSDQTQRLESIYQQKLAALEALKKSLLHQAFSGQL
jgi:type I restriction enzyme, S subunit